MNEVLRLVQDMVGQKAKVRHNEPLEGDIRRMKCDYSKARERLGFKPTYSVNDGIKRLIEYADMGHA